MTVNPAVKVGLVVAAATAAAFGLFYIYSGKNKIEVEEDQKPLHEEEDKVVVKDKEVAKDESETWDAEKLKKEGNLQFSRGHFDSAIDLYTKAIQRQPDPAELSKCYANRAACYSKLKDHEKVIADCTEALALQPKYDKAMCRRAQAYQALDRLEEAMLDYVGQLRVQTNPAEKEKISQSADQLLQKISRKKAKELLKEKQGSFPSSVIVKTYLSTYKSHTESVTEAEDELRGSADSVALSAYKLGMKLVERTEYREALDWFTKAVELDSSMAEAHRERGTLLHLSGSLSDALQEFETANQLAPKDVENLVKWANAIFFDGDLERGNTMLDDAINVAPKETVAYFHAGQAMSQQGLFDKATTYFSKMIELDAANYQAYNHRAQAYSRVLETATDPLSAQHAYEAATKDLLKAIKLKPNEPDAYNSYGLLLRAWGQNDQASKQFEKAIQVAPKSPAAYLNKGFYQLHVNSDRDGAEKQFLKALELEPTCIEALCNLAVVHLATDPDKAIRYYDDALELSFFEQDLATIIAFKEAAKIAKEIGM